jgi:hypothetical protein
MFMDHDHCFHYIKDLAEHVFNNMDKCSSARNLLEDKQDQSVGEMLTVNFGTPNIFITLLFELDYGTNPPLGTLMVWHIQLCMHLKCCIFAGNTWT